MRVSMSAIGSLTAIDNSRFLACVSFDSNTLPTSAAGLPGDPPHPPASAPRGDRPPRETYQLLLRIPGILPSSASFRSMMRLMRNLRYTPRARPVSSHRRTVRVENFGLRFARATCAFVAIRPLLRCSCPLSSPLWRAAGLRPTQRSACRPLSFPGSLDPALTPSTPDYAAFSAFFSSFWKGMPSSARKKRLNSGFERSKTRLMFMPCVKVTSAMLISGNTPCSVSPIE